MEHTRLLLIRLSYVADYQTCLQEAWRVVGRLEGGQTQAEVAEANGVSQSVISSIWNRFFGDWKCRPKTRTRS
ncbi:hypothetical protein TNCV_1673561 [Trichonephila clavipes]|nr:hypothetical protein TNCV_1673561 [Trichonephila clavipes]